MSSVAGWAGGVSEDVSVQGRIHVHESSGTLFFISPGISCPSFMATCLWRSARSVAGKVKRRWVSLRFHVAASSSLCCCKFCRTLYAHEGKRGTSALNSSCWLCDLIVSCKKFAVIVPYIFDSSMMVKKMLCLTLWCPEELLQVLFLFVNLKS